MPNSPQVTIFGTPLGGLVLEELQGHLQTFLDGTIIDEGDNYEVEAKFGIYVDRSTNQRISLPVLTTCVLAPGEWYRFEADLGMEQHRHFNTVLNAQVAQNQSSWRYKHEKTVDTFYTNPQRKKIRVSRDMQTNRILHAMEKRRLADLAIHIPACPFDVRISVNLETIQPNLTEESLQGWPQVEGERLKDRISYEFGDLLKVDLTQVRQSGNVAGSIPKHELEVELIDVRAQLGGDPALVAKFLCNVLDLARHTFQ